jgi:hypothetical protein
MNRRELLIAGSAALGMAYVPGLADADSLPLGKASGFRYVPAPGSPFSSGVVAMEGYTFLRIRLRSALPLADGLASASREMKALGCPPNALAGLELRAPQRMTRPSFVEFNQRYLTLLKQAGFPIGDTVSIARSDMVPRFDSPEVDSLVAFTFAVQQKSSASRNGGPDFLTSGTPEVASNPNRVIAANDSSPAGMDKKARFVWDALRQTVASLGARWADISGTQIYMTEPLETVLSATRAAGVLPSGLTLYPGETPVIGFGEVPYAFEADVRAISREEIL